MLLDDFGIGKKPGAPGAPYPRQQHETLWEGLFSLTQKRREFSMVVSILVHLSDEPQNPASSSSAQLLFCKLQMRVRLNNSTRFLLYLGSTELFKPRNR